MSKSTKLTHSVCKRFTNYFNSYNFLGVIVGALFVYAGFLPSLLPRGFMLQGILAGVAFTIGYAVGILISHIIRQFKPKEPQAKTKSKIKLYAFITLLVLYIIFDILGFKWQNEVRELVQLEQVNEIYPLSITLIAFITVVIIMLISRSVRSFFHWIDKQINKVVPKSVAYIFGWIITFLLVVGLINGVILNGLVSMMDSAFSTRNGTTEAGIKKPTVPELSGSPESYIPWNTLGMQGRNFIGLASTTNQLSEFNGTDALQPIRIYSGLESADSAESRAELAVKDLKRAGGFDRKIIVVVTTTGTGWVNESGVDPIEFMYNGDSAVIAMQYSYLPSWLSFLVDKQRAKEAGTALYEAVSSAVLDIPQAQRPKIVSFGESLGSFGGESAFSGEAAFRATSDGAVWSGPPNSNVLWSTATDSREKGTPEILPIYKDGELLRFARTADDFKTPSIKTWGNPRAVYLQNPSDPIIWWSPDLILHKPDWLKEKRGADVSPRTRWIPFVTFFQVSGDMLFSTGVPDGHGHKYEKLPTTAWGYVAPPAGWTMAKTEKLEKYFEENNVK